MDPRQIYKAAFLYRCLEEQLTEAQIKERIKRASLKSGGIEAKDVINTLSSLGSFGGRALTGTMMASVPITAGIGLGAGYLGGTALAKMTDPGYSPEELARQELISTYDSLADEMEAKRQNNAEVGL
jgi:hypothetical protein